MVLQLTIVVATVLLGFAALRSVQAVAGLSTAAPSVAAALTGAIYTSTADGTTVNANLYEQCDQVYLDGGPQNQNGGGGLPPGTYYFQVTNPNGDVLLSTDNAVCRQLTVNSSGAIAGATGPCPHTNGITNPANGNTPVQLYPFNATPNIAVCS